MLKITFCVLVLLSIFADYSEANEKQKILFIASNVEHMGDPEEHDARNNLWEFAPPYHVFVMHGYHVDIVSPKGGEVPFMMEPMGISSYTMKYEGFTDKTRHTLTPAAVRVEDYSGVYVGGGYGVMFDVSNNLELNTLIANIYQRGGVVGSCGHGTAGIVNVKLADGSPLVKDKRVAGFPNATELTKPWAKFGTLLPFLIEDKLRENGALVINKDNIADKHEVIVDKRVVSSMFLPSAALVAKEMILALENARPATPKTNQESLSPSR